MFKQTLHEALRRAAAFVSPNLCPFCGRLCGVSEYFHENCYAALPFMDSETQAPCGVTRLTAVCRYENSARRAVLEYKKGFYIYSAEAFAALMSEALGKELAGYDMIVPVPSAPERYFKRGYSPAGKIARLISNRCGVPLCSVLKAHSGISEQKSLSAAERKENARLLFELKRRVDLSGRSVLLTDDVCTTGSTLSVCAMLLRKAGAADVDAAVFARTIEKRENGE